MQHRRGALLNNTPYLAMAALAVLFSLCMDEIGYLNLARRERDAIAGMAAFEQSAGKPASGGPVLPFPHETAQSDRVPRPGRGRF